MKPHCLRFALAFSLLTFSTCAREGDRPDERPIQPDELAAVLSQAEPPLLLDVRSPEEFASGHVPGATLVPIQELEGRVAELDAARQRGVVTYCEAGGRAGKASELLRAHGFANVRLLDGSMRRWREEGREIETGL